MAFAGVLAMRPSVLVLDEPVAGLDPASREDFLILIEKFHRSGLTIVMVSHNMNDISRLADRVLVMNKGEIAWLGTPEEVFSHAKELREIGLGVPHSVRLANELRDLGFNLEEKLYLPNTLADAIAKELSRHCSVLENKAPKDRAPESKPSETKAATSSQEQSGEE